MNGTTPEAPPAPASEPVWERPWSVEEIRRSSQSWSLAADAGLLQFLQEFSQQTITRTHEIKKQMDGLIRETKATDCRLHNVFNDFLMLSNTQFIENRVYDEEVEEPVVKTEPEKNEQEKTREQKEVDLIPKVQEAVNYGLQVLDSAFEQLDIKAGNSDSEEEDANERVELILEPKDLYIDRPLPYLIGSKLFMEQEDIGLGELSSEEGSVGSDHGSFVDSEEENEEEHTAHLSEEEEDDDGCDIFADSEKEEEDTEDFEQNTRPKRSRPTSFADELAARIKGDSTIQIGESQTRDSKAWKILKEKERTAASDDEESNLYTPPQLTDEDFLPFASRRGLFSRSQGLFDEEEGEGDLFTEAPKDREVSTIVHTGDADVFDVSSAPSLKEAPKSGQPTTEKSPHLPALPSGLFDDDDEDDNFFIASCSKPSKIDREKSTADIFDDVEGDLFKETEAALPNAAVNHTDESKVRAERQVTLPPSKNLKLLSETKTQKGLFSDEEDSEDNFLGATAAKKQTSSLPTRSQEKTKLSEPSKKKASALLFSSDEEDQWHTADSQTDSASDNRSKGEHGDSKITQNPEAKNTVKKINLFEEDNDDDLFAIAKNSQKKTQRVSLLFEDDADSGSFLFGSPPTAFPPATMEKETVAQTTPLLFRDEEEEEASFRLKSTEENVNKSIGPSDNDRANATEESGKESSLTISAQAVVKPSDVFPSSSSLEKGAKGRTKTVLSLFDEEEDRTEDQSSIHAPQKEVGKNPDPDNYFKSTGVFQNEERLFSHKLQKDNDPDVDLFSGTQKNRLIEPHVHVGSLFEDDEDDDLFTSVKSQPLIPEKKKAVKKYHSASSFKNQKPPEPNQGIKAKSIGKLETPQDSSGPTSLKTKEPSTRIGKIQANLMINPAALLPVVAHQNSGTKSALPELTLPPSESQNAETSVSFDLPAQANTLRSANKSRIKVRGRRRPQTRAARRLAAQESSEAEDMNAPGRLTADRANDTISPDFHQPQPKSSSRKDNSVAVAAPILEDSSVPGVARSPFTKSLGQPLEDDLFDSDDIFSKGAGSQSTGRAKVQEKGSEGLASQPGGGKGQSCIFSALSEAGSDNDLFQSVKPKPAKETHPFPLLEDDDNLFNDRKGKKNESKLNSQDDLLKTQDIFEDDIFATEAIKPSQKTREKERTLESNLFVDNIDIFADLTVKPKEKFKKKVEAKSIFDDDMDDIFSSGTPAKKTKPKCQSAQSMPELKSEHKVANIFDDPLNAFGGD
ncbi:WASH complex subunit 2A [Echinops telfairi]|uniref:WASH complex subunit 2A n=1 Tax=Echinops telfairi TaxID=9371 RepID=A0AC55CPH5_ECHTE|nr:WASH complex subunit 2A [Echinops telfairi]